MSQIQQYGEQMAHSEDLASIPNDRRVCVQVGENRGGGVEVKQEEMIEVLTALNNKPFFREN